MAKHAPLFGASRLSDCTRDRRSPEAGGTFCPAPRRWLCQNERATRVRSIPTLSPSNNFDVAAGKFSVYSEVVIKDGNINGYVKPMFANVEVYDYQKDKSKPLLHQAKELVIDGATHLFKNSSTQQVASDIDLTGRLSSPQTSTWQAIAPVLRNAFIKAIIPGFDRAVALESGTDNVRNSHTSH